MKALITILFMSLLATITLSAQGAKITSRMKSAGEKYVKMYLKEFPESANGLSSTRARKMQYDLLATTKMLTVDEATQELLRRSKEVVTTPQMQTLINNLAEDDSKETKFLLTLASNQNLKGEGKLLVFRLLGRSDKRYKDKLKEEAANRVVGDKELLKPSAESTNNTPPAKKTDDKSATHEIVDRAYAEKVMRDFAAAFKIILTRQKETSIWPASLEGAGVSEDLLTVDSPDKTQKKQWVYVASAAKIAVSRKQYIIMVSPYPVNCLHLVALSDGKVITVSPSEYEKIMEIVRFK